MCKSAACRGLVLCAQQGALWSLKVGPVSQQSKVHSPSDGSQLSSQGRHKFPKSPNPQPTELFWSLWVSWLCAVPLWESFFHPYTLQNFCSLSSFLFCSFVKIISLQVIQSFFEDSQRHKAFLLDCIPGHFKEVAENEICMCLCVHGHLHQEHGALACQGTGVCNHTNDWSRADSLWGLREGRFSFLNCACFSL